MTPIQIQYGINLSCAHHRKGGLKSRSSGLIPGLENTLRDLSNGMDPYPQVWPVCHCSFHTWKRSQGSPLRHHRYQGSSVVEQRNFILSLIW
jgi:hypothetical protein